MQKQILALREMKYSAKYDDYLKKIFNQMHTFVQTNDFSEKKFVFHDEI